ncbi:MAG TPA: type II secretion system F family protein [Actinomycetota bacterium]|jgi:tight adherence protein C
MTGPAPALPLHGPALATGLPHGPALAAGLPLDAPALLAALAIGAFAGALVALVVRPTRRLAGRVRPYTTVARVALGRSPDVLPVAASEPALSPGVVGRLFGPPLASLARSLGDVLDLGSDDALRLKLRQAGYPTDPQSFRMRQLGATAAGGAGAAALGLVLHTSPALVLLLTLLGLVAGAARGRGALDRTIDLRRRRMRIELYTVNQLLAVHLRTGGGPIQAVQRLVERGHGAVIDELSEALRLIGGGIRPAEAFTRLAATTAEPQAARTYELLASGAERGADLAGAMLSLSDDIRQTRREDLRRAATRRRAAMLVPIVAILAPVMLLFLIPPLLSFVWTP